MVDGDKKPMMGFIYEAIQLMKKVIKETVPHSSIGYMKNVDENNPTCVFTHFKKTVFVLVKLICQVTSCIVLADNLNWFILNFSLIPQPQVLAYTKCQHSAQPNQC